MEKYISYTPFAPPLLMWWNILDITCTDDILMYRRAHTHIYQALYFVATGNNFEYATSCFHVKKYETNLGIYIPSKQEIFILHTNSHQIWEHHIVITNSRGDRICQKFLASRFANCRIPCRNSPQSFVKIYLKWKHPFEIYIRRNSIMSNRI